MKRIIPRNNPISTVIKNFINKDSGKVTAAKREIQRRFAGLDWKDQKKIILAYLDSCKSDREWIYLRMYLNWDDVFLPKAKEVWEKYHEFRCSWSVIRYFPEEYLLENMSSFNAPRDYYFLCLRLGHRQDFTIDRTRLTNKDYIGVLHHNRLPIEDDEALDLLFETVHDICVNENFNRRYDLIENRYYIPTNIYSIKSFHDIGESLYYLKEMGRFRVVEDFCKWNDEIVCRNMTEGPEIKELASLIKDEDVIECAGIAKKYGYLAWDDKYKQPGDPLPEKMLKHIRSTEYHSIIPKDESSFENSLQEDEVPF